jgi:hypothetical protein
MCRACFCRPARAVISVALFCRPRGDLLMKLLGVNGGILKKKLQVSDQLLDKLRENRILLTHHTENLKQTSDAEKVEKLLDTLRRRDDAMFASFCRVLVEMQQKPAVKVLLQRSQTNVKVITSGIHLKGVFRV